MKLDCRKKLLSKVPSNGEWGTLKVRQPATVLFQRFKFWRLLWSNPKVCANKPSLEKIKYVIWTYTSSSLPFHFQDEKYAIQNYGSTESGEAPYSNYSNHIVAQPVQPPTQDTYMNQDRNIVEEPRNEFNPFKNASTNPFAK